MKRFKPVSSKFPRILHGGDYNPDQWTDVPGIWDEDMRLMKLAHCNVMSVGIFSWAQLEPEEGNFQFGWLDEILDRMYAQGVHAFLATPSGARPAWMSAKYPEVLRVGPNRVRNLHGERHNHCYTSPLYREKVGIINRKLAERYGNHPALLAWHISNEYGGECHCDLCQEAFRQWLQRKYGNLETLNRAWWTAFWSHTYTDWSQLESPAPHGERSIHALYIDWKRFVTDQTVDFIRHEIIPIRELTPDIPVTTNLMGLYPELDYWKFADVLDVVSWDTYPPWHGTRPDWDMACEVGFTHDFNRSLKKGQPFLLMESTPSTTNWMQVCKLKRPGMHMLTSLQAVAHGSDSVQYFQWRKSRGSYEKFHGAVVDHCGHENTRVFKDVAALGSALEQLDPLVGTSVEPEVAIIFDWENRWAIEEAQGPRRNDRDYMGTCIRHYNSFWQRGVPVDIINQGSDLKPYKLVIAPMLYMLQPGFADNISAFVNRGGCFVTTYWTGIVDQNDLCFLGGFPGPLRELLGIWSEEIDSLYIGEHNSVVPLAGNGLGLQREYEAGILCDLIHAETATVLATYGSDFYAGRPALTVNTYGAGESYYIASRNEQPFLNDFYAAIIDRLNIATIIDAAIPRGVSVQKRVAEDREFIFVLNFNADAQQVNLGARNYRDMLGKQTITGPVTLEAYGVLILETTSD